MTKDMQLLILREFKFKLLVFFFQSRYLKGLKWKEMWKPSFLYILRRQYVFSKASTPFGIVFFVAASHKRF